MDLERVCLFSHDDQYGANRCLTDQLASAFKRQGIEVLQHDTTKGPINDKVLSNIKNFFPNLLCSFGRFEPVLEIPHLSILYEPVFYATDLTENPFSIIGCGDQDDVATLQGAGYNRALFFSPAVEKDFFARPQKQKIYDIVFVGSCYDYESLRMAWKARQPEALNKVLDDAIDLILSSDRLPLAEALVQAWNEAKCDPRGVDFPTLFKYLDYYIRGKDRVELIKSIKDVPIHLFGDLSEENPVGILNWSQYLANQKNVTVHPAVPFNETMDLFAQAKIVLNSTPFYRNGADVRVFAALALGAYPITSASVFLSQEFTHEEMLIYSSKNYGEIGPYINKLLSNTQEREEKVKLGQHLIQKHHTWDARVDQLRKMFSNQSG